MGLEYVCVGCGMGGGGSGLMLCADVAMYWVRILEGFCYYIPWVGWVILGVIIVNV